MLRTSYATTPSSRVQGRFAALLLPLFLSVMGVMSGCDKDNNQAERRYCDAGGCYACVGDKCYPVPGDPAKPDPVPGNGKACDTDAACKAGSLCNLGKCETACGADTNCATGETCISGHCRPAGAQQCGTNRRCVSRACASNCTTDSCALGQVCSAGSCIEDPAPKSAQCLYDADCGAGKGGFRCVNAYCLPTCATSTQCKSGASCVSGICRASRLAN